MDVNEAEKRQRRISEGRMFHDFLEDERTKAVFQILGNELFKKWYNTDKGDEARDLYLKARGLRLLREKMAEIVAQGRLEESKAEKEHDEDEKGYGSQPMTGKQLRHRPRT